LTDVALRDQRFPPAQPISAIANPADRLSAIARRRVIDDLSQSSG